MTQNPNDKQEITPKTENPLPLNPTPIEKLKHRLQTKEGKSIYTTRKSTVEPIFGIIKHVIGFRQFMLFMLY